MKTRILLPVLLLSAVFVSPASANWFVNSGWNIQMFIGSAPNPTPEDIRAGKQPTLVQDAQGNVIAMIDPRTGQTLAVAESLVTAPASSTTAKKAPEGVPPR